MNESKTWRKCKIKCPENFGDTELFAEWCIEKEGQVLKSLSCNNPKLRDLSWQDCNWSCWDEISNTE
jgi:hypothetical protein